MPAHCREEGNAGKLSQTPSGAAGDFSKGGIANRGNALPDETIKEFLIKRAFKQQRRC
jgi:hypothetical protein